MPGQDYTLATIGPELERTNRRIQKAVVRGLFKAAQLSRNAVIAAISATTPFAPIDTGEMSRVSSWPITPIMEGGQRIGWALDAATVQADVMEFGTQPFWPPFDPLYAWALRKQRKARKPVRGKGRKPGRKNERNKTRDKTKRKPRRGPTKSQQQKAKRFANAVRYKISKKGIAPRGYYARASQHFDRIVQQELTRAVSSVNR